MDPMTGAEVADCASLDALQQLEYLHGPDATKAIIALNGDKTLGRTAAGYFRDQVNLCLAIQLLFGKADVFTTLNAISNEIYGRGADRVKPYVRTTVGQD